MEALKLTKIASRFAVAVEDAEEEPGPLAKPDTSAVTLPGGDTDALAVARAFPLEICGVCVGPGKGTKEILVPGGSTGIESEAWAKAL